MNDCILMGSSRKNGNTAALLAPFIEELERAEERCEVIWLCDRQIGPCVTCRRCQQDWSRFVCVHDDDGQALFDGIMACDVLVLATPIYSWYCRHAQLSYLGMLCERHMGYDTVGKEGRARAFARALRAEG